MRRVSIFIAGAATVLASCGGAAVTPESSGLLEGPAVVEEADPEIVIDTVQNLVDALAACLQGDERFCEAKDNALSEEGGEFVASFSEAESWWSESCLNGIAEACRRLSETSDLNSLSEDVQNAVDKCYDSTAIICHVSSGDTTLEDEGITELIDGIIAGCEAGDPVACDVVRTAFPLGSEEEIAARECGYKDPAEALDRCISTEEMEESRVPDGEKIPMSVGDDPELDAFYDECNAGEALSCDALRTLGPPGSEYKELGEVCGPAGEFDGVSCDQSTPRRLGDDPELDELASACVAGSLVDCDRLRFEAGINTDYMYLALTCGEIRSPDSFEVYVSKPCVELDWETTPWSADDLESARLFYEQDLASGWKLTKVS